MASINLSALKKDFPGAEKVRPSLTFFNGYVVRKDWESQRGIYESTLATTSVAFHCNTPAFVDTIIHLRE